MKETQQSLHTNPLVSILLLSMNHEKFIEQCIVSLKEQTYKNIEVIYLDNASVDRTFEVGKKALKESGVSHKIFSNAESKGISKNLNFLFKNSTGEYIIPLSTDDWLTPDSICEKVKCYLEHSEFGMVYSSCFYYLHDTAEKIECPRKNKFKSGWVLPEILKGNFIRSVGSIIKRETLNTVGLFDEDSLLEDWDMWIRIATKFPLGYINKELAFYRIKTGTNVTANNDYMFKGADYIVQKYSHYKEIQEAKKNITISKCYSYATYKPSFKTIFFILENSEFDFFYFKQLVKTVLGIVRKPFIKRTIISN
ncbi:MAG: glycosyltransferase [Ginsengibacter sp.]